jgi:hypothetical protein
MYTKPMIFPLDSDGMLYALQDDKGNQIGTGSREACQTLLYLITTSPLMQRPPRYVNRRDPRVRRRSVSAKQK